MIESVRVLEEEELPLELRPWVFEVTARSETPIQKFFERLPRDINADRLERRYYIVSGPVSAFKNLIREHSDLKFSKALLVFLLKWRPSEVEDLVPKHRIIPPQDLSFSFLEKEEVMNLSPPVKARHLYFGVEFLVSAEGLVEVLRSRLPFEWAKVDGGFKVVVCGSVADLLVYLLKPLEEVLSDGRKARFAIEELVKRVPECFGRGG